MNDGTVHMQYFFITRKRHANYDLNHIEWFSIEYI